MYFPLAYKTVWTFSSALQLYYTCPNKLLWLEEDFHCGQGRFICSCVFFVPFLKREKDFLGGPLVKTLLSNAGGPCSIPGQGARIPPASRPKHQNIKKKKKNRNNTVTNSIKTFKNGPHQKKKNLKKKKKLGKHLLSSVLKSLSI